MLALLVPVAGGSAGAAPASTETISASVRLDAYDGPPAVGFEVRLVEPASEPLMWADVKILPATITDSQGRYSLDGLQSDESYVVVVSDPNGNYATERFYFQGGADLEADREVMAWGVPATGSVKDDKGRAVAGALVTANAITYEADSNGNFAIPAVGPYFSTNNFVDISASSADGLYAQPFQRFSITKGVPAVLDVTLLERLFVSGKVVDSAGQPVANAYVQSVAYNGLGPGDTALGAKTDSNGNYRYEYFEGSNDFSVRVNGEWEGVLVNGVDNPKVDINGQATVNLAIKQRGRLSGNVKTPTGDGLSGAVVEVWRHDSNYDFCSRFCSNRPFKTFAVDENGDWTLENAPAVEYSIIVRQALSGSAIPKRFTLASGGTQSGLDATTTNTFLKGQVLGSTGNSLSGVGVIAGPESSVRGEDAFGIGGWYKSAVDDEGRFRVAVMPGDYLLQAGYGGENRTLEEGGGVEFRPGFRTRALYDGPKSSNNVIRVGAGETIDGLIGKYDLREFIPRPPAMLTFPGVELTKQGVPILRDLSPLAVALSGCSNATAKLSTLAYGVIWQNAGSLSENPTGSGSYLGEIDIAKYFDNVLPPSDAAAPKQLRVRLDCNDSVDLELFSGMVYPDRAGMVVDQNDDPVAGATVLLFRAGKPIASNPIALSLFKTGSEQTTGTSGRFDWETNRLAQSSQKSGMTVRVTAPGCTVPGSPSKKIAASGDLVTFQTVKLQCATSTAPTTSTSTTTSSTTAPPVTSTQTALAAKSGYWMLEAGGTIHSFGDAAKLSAVKDRQVVGFDRTSARDGLWILDSTGQVHVRGGATHYGNVDLSALTAGEQVASISATPSDKGYWVYTDLGRVLTFGDAVHYNDLPGLGIQPVGRIVASAPTASGMGYYMLGSDGGVFAFGDATFAGSIPQVLPAGSLACSIVGLVPMPSGDGYWMVGCDGGVFAFGSAPFRGSVPGVLAQGVSLNSPINGLVPYGNGYLTVAADGGVFTFSDLKFLGSLGANPPDSSIVAITAFSS